MANRSMMAVLVGAILVGAPSIAAAQQWGREPTPRSGACFYREPNFRGDYFCVAAGEAVRDMPNGMNDKVSSIQIFGRAEVTVFQDRSFEGRAIRFDYDVPDLRREGWNDLISSFRVRGGSYYGHDHSRGYGRGQGYSGQEYNSNADLIVRRAYQDILDREPDDAGLRLYRRRIVDEGWTEGQVREALRNSPEYRQQSSMTYSRAQEIVRQAYLAVFQREPDSASRGYVSRVINDHWTQQDVERELRKSPEYRNRR